MVSKDHKLGVRRQCKPLILTRTHLYYESKGESAEKLRFMEIIDRHPRHAMVRVTSNVALHAAQQPQIRVASGAPPNAACAFGSDLSGTNISHQQETSAAQDLALSAPERGD